VTLKPLPKESDGHKIAKALSCGGGVGRVVGFTPGWVVVAPPLAAAVRVSLMCINRKLSPEPFFRTETVRRGSAARRPGRRLREQGLE
jgi:hypothetical protein